MGFQLLKKNRRYLFILVCIHYDLTFMYTFIVLLLIIVHWKLIFLEVLQYFLVWLFLILVPLDIILHHLYH